MTTTVQTEPSVVQELVQTGWLVRSIYASGYVESVHPVIDSDDPVVVIRITHPVVLQGYSAALWSNHCKEWEVISKEV